MTVRPPARARAHVLTHLQARPLAHARVLACKHSCAFARARARACPGARAPLRVPAHQRAQATARPHAH
eukprot:15246556-Alexandrium_andersonii.AAC.1